MTDSLEPDVGPETIPLADQAARAGAVTVSAEGARMLIETLGLVVLARLLMPDDFGRVAMVAAIIGLVSLSDFGLPAAMVQRPGLTRAELSSLFWLNGAIGLAAAGLVAVSAPAIAWFYGEPRLTGIALALSSLFLLRGLSAQPQALLRRQLRFSALALVDVGAVTMGTIAAVGSAWRGAGFWALVIHQLVTALCAAAGAWWAAGWCPSSPFDRAPVRRLLTFGGDVTAARSLQFMSRSVAQILIGTASGAAALGLYTNAYNLLFRPILRLNNPLVPVACAVLARLADEPTQYRAYFRRGNLALNSLTLPFLAFLAVDAERAVLVVLGDRWLELVPLLRALLVAALMRALFMSTQWVYLSLGRTREQLRWGMLRTGVTLIGVVVGINWGAFGVALALSVTSVMVLFPAISWVIAVSPLRWTDFVASSVAPAGAAAGAALALLAAGALIPFAEPPLARLLLDGVGFGVVYASAWLISSGGSTVKFFSARS
jgi:O-antigen/teichoic acid export membrane protein